MEKRFVHIVLVVVGLVEGFAQSNFNVQMNPQVKDSTLVLDVYIKKTSGVDFALGTSNFDVLLKSPNLDISKAKFFSGEFDATSHPSSYNTMGVGNQEVLVMNVNANVEGSGQGVLVTDSSSKIGTVQIPITNPCATVQPLWNKDGSAIHSYSKGAIAPNITSKATYSDPSSIDLDGGISKTIPTVAFDGVKLKSSSATNNQWYLDGTAINGATKPELTPLVGGNYSVQVTYPCAKNFSTPVPVTVTGLTEDFSLTYSFNAQPNPFIGESTIQYTLSNPANIQLQLYDLSGVFIMDLDNGQRSQGKNTFSLKPTNLGLPAGMYVLKLNINDKMGTLKLVSMK